MATTTTTTTTEEQRAVVGASASTVLVQAYAGTGKTTTLRMVAGAQPSGVRVLYVCFGRQTERRFSSPGVRSTTFDALCFRHFGETRPPSPINKWTVRRELGVDDDVAERIAGELEAGGEISPEARVLWDMMAPGGSGSFSCFARLRRAFYDEAEAAGGWNLGYDLLLVDECQDLNPVMLESLLLFSGRRVFVGDRFQHIFGFLGTVDAFARLGCIPGVERLALTRSFRFGPVIAKLASDIVGAGAIVGDAPDAGIVRRATPRNRGIPNGTTVLAVKNATLLGLAFDAADRGRTIHLLGRDGFLDLIDVEYERYQRDGATITQSRMIGAQLREDTDRAGALQLILRYGRDLRAKLDGVRDASADEGDADLVLSTIHKSKGLEWDRVWLVDDLEVGARGREKNGAELVAAMDEKNRLYYVGVTRAKREVWFPDSLRTEFGL